MKKILFPITAFLLLVWLSAPLLSQNYFSKKKNFSILGEDKERVFSTLFSTGPKQQAPVKPETPPEALPQSAELAGQDFLSFLEQRKVLKYSEDRWLKIKKQKEEGRIAAEEQAGVAVSTVARPAPAPLPPGLAVELPYESQLSISGRKMIGVSFKQTLYDKEETNKRKNSGSFDMQQELQVRIKGRVGRKINVNVDFDDTTADKRDISVVYKGDPDEVVQEAAFGDITMSLPSTEFVGYSRQLFGIKVDAKPTKSSRFWGFFSRTKGDSEIKRFTGNTQLVRNTLADTSYIPYKYYTLKFSASDTIQAGTVKIYRDRMDPTKINANTSTNTVVEIINTVLPGASTTYTGNFDLLVPGQDYTVDYTRGIVMFRNALTQNFVVAVDYLKGDGTYLSSGGSVPGAWKVIKDAGNTVGVTKELKTFYNLGNVKIVRDNGRGNFILKVQDLNNNDPSVLTDNASPPQTKSVPTYPSNITVDFENGIFNFEPPDGKPFPDDLYSVNTHRYNILYEYHYRLKYINLNRTGIVAQSERVTVDGKLQARDVDYYIDYDAGMVTFFNEEKITDTSVVEVSYDYAPFGSTGGSTLIGLRTEIAVNSKLSLGSSFIYDFAAKTQTVPDIRTTPTSLKVWEVDSKLQNIKVPLLPVTWSVGGEYAQSERNPNIMGKATVESFEGLKQDDSASINYESWQPGANPTIPGFYAQDVTLANEELNLRDINPNVDPKRDEKTQVLSISYDVSRSTELSVIQSLSKVGMDYSKKVYLETWIYGDGKGEDLNFSYGSFSEDADNTGVLKTEDLNGDGTLNAGEDIGWPFRNPDGSITRIGAGNGKLDTEDLDGTGVLARFDTVASPGVYGPGYGNFAVDQNGVTHANVDWTGWKFFQIPLNITDPTQWQSVKQVRLSIKGASGQKGNIKIHYVSLVNFKWQATPVTVAGSTVSISAINTDDDTRFGGAGNNLMNNSYYRDLYDITTDDSLNKKEQGMSILYKVDGATSAALSANITYSRAYDLSNYHELRFFVNPYTYQTTGAGGDDRIFIRAGNEANYYEYSVPIKNLGNVDPVHGYNWYMIRIFQYGKTNKAEFWAVDPNGSTVSASVVGSSTSIVGSPSLQNITQVKIGVYANGPTGGYREVWVDELHVNDVWAKVGHAWRVNTDFNVTGLGAFGGKRKLINRDFETFSGGIYNRDYIDDSSYVNLGLINWLPVNYTIGRTKTITPSVVQNQNDLLSLNDEGRVISYTESVGSSLNPGDPFQWASKSLFGSSPNISRYFPRFGASYTRAITDSQQISRLQDDQTINTTADWPFPVKFALFPTNISANYGITNSYFRVYPATRIIDTDDFEKTNFIDTPIYDKYKQIEDFHTRDISETYGLRAPFQFWDGLSFSPSYTLSTVREDNKDINYNFNKSASQNVASSLSWRVFNWFQPSFSFNSTISENYTITFNTTTTPVVYPGQYKYIERNNSGEVAWNFQVRDMFRYKYTQSLGFSSSYRTQDSDSYDGVRSSYTVIGLDKLWIRNTPLADQQTTGYFLAMKSLLRRDDVRLSGRYNPLEAFDFPYRLSPFKTLSTNFTYTNSDEHSMVTGTEKDSFTRIWPDVIFGLAEWEKLFSVERWLSGTQLNFSHQKKYSEIKKISNSTTNSYSSDARFYLLKKYDMSMGVAMTEGFDYDTVKIDPVLTNQSFSQSWNTQVGFYLGKWRFTTRLENSTAWGVSGTGIRTSDSKTTTFSTQVNSDMSFPGGVPIPFTKKVLPLTNRLIFNSGFNFTRKESALNVESSNTDTYGLNSTVDYEISSNFRSSFGLGYSRVLNREKSDENYSTIEANAKLTIQF